MTPHPAEPVQRPLVRLDFFAEMVLLTRFGESHSQTCYPVAVEDVAGVFTDIRLATGLLPRETLFWQKQGDVTTLAIYVPARRWQVQVMDERTYHIPLPPMMFVGRGRNYYVYALRSRPRGPHTPLWHFPSPNVSDNGSICLGNAPFPTCTTATIYSALHLFLEGSAFNDHLVQGRSATFPDDVRQLWELLDGQKRFPSHHLSPLNVTLGQLMRQLKAE